jgi:hypothetical protein
MFLLMNVENYVLQWRVAYAKFRENRSGAKIAHTVTSRISHKSVCVCFLRTEWRRTLLAVLYDFT